MVAASVKEALAGDQCLCPCQFYWARKLYWEVVELSLYREKREGTATRIVFKESRICNLDRHTLTKYQLLNTWHYFIKFKFLQTH